LAFEVIAAEIATEIRLLRAAEADRDRHEQAREDAYPAFRTSRTAFSAIHVTGL
jgi:hypothetical protein